MSLEEATIERQTNIKPSTSALATDTVRSKITYEQVTITPGVAQAWLDRNERNRTLRRRLVDRLAKDIRSGKWEVCGDAIRFDSDGNLIDGQHRLTACVEANIPIKSFVVYGLDASTQNIIDTGVARSKGDMLALHGVTGANNVAYAYRLLHAHKHGYIPTGDNMTHADLVDVFERHPKLPLYVPSPGSLPRGLPLGLVGFVNYAGSLILKKKDRADAMIAVLRTGIPDYEGDIMHRFRERILSRKLNPNGERQKRHEVIWTFYHCWNLFSAKDTTGSRLTTQRESVKIEWLKPGQL